MRCAQKESKKIPSRTKFCHIVFVLDAFFFIRSFSAEVIIFFHLLLYTGHPLSEVFRFFGVMREWKPPMTGRIRFLFRSVWPTARCSPLGQRKCSTYDTAGQCTLRYHHTHTILCENDSSIDWAKQWLDKQLEIESLEINPSSLFNPIQCEYCARTRRIHLALFNCKHVCRHFTSIAIELRFIYLCVAWWPCWCVVIAAKNSVWVMWMCSKHEQMKRLRLITLMRMNLRIGQMLQSALKPIKAMPKQHCIYKPSP